MWSTGTYTSHSEFTRQKPKDRISIKKLEHSILKYKKKSQKNHLKSHIFINISYIFRFIENDMGNTVKTSKKGNINDILSFFRRSTKLKKKNVISGNKHSISCLF